MNYFNYDPNLATSTRFAQHTVRVTLGTWDYRKVFDVELVSKSGRLGYNVLKGAIWGAICMAEEEFMESYTDNPDMAHLQEAVEKRMYMEVVLTNPEGKELVVDMADYFADGWEAEPNIRETFEDLIIGLEVIDYKEEEDEDA